MGVEYQIEIREFVHDIIILTEYKIKNDDPTT